MCWRSPARGAAPPRRRPGSCGSGPSRRGLRAAACRIPQGPIRSMRRPWPWPARMPTPTRPVPAAAAAKAGLQGRKVPVTSRAKGGSAKGTESVLRRERSAEQPVALREEGEGGRGREREGEGGHGQAGRYQKFRGLRHTWTKWHRPSWTGHLDQSKLRNPNMARRGQGTAKDLNPAGSLACHAAGSRRGWDRLPGTAC